MILNLCNLENCIYTDFGDHIISIECLNKTLIQDIIFELMGRDVAVNNINIMDKSGPIDLSKNCQVIIDFFNINLYDRSFYKKLYDVIIKRNATHRDIINDFLKLTNLINNNIADLMSELDVEYEISDNVDIVDYLKLFDLKVYDEDNILTKLLMLIKLNNILHFSQVIVMINLKSLLERDELIRLYRNALYNNVNLLLIDSTRHSKVKYYEHKIIIDKDLYDYYE